MNNYIPKQQFIKFMLLLGITLINLNNKQTKTKSQKEKHFTNH